MFSRLESALLSLVFCACAGQSDKRDAGEADLPDAAPLTIGDICRLLTPATCERDAECFQDLPPPCEDSLMERCCGEAGTCDEINGVTHDRVEDCIAAIEEGTCAELEELPVPCREIAVPMDQALQSSGSWQVPTWLDSVFLATGSR